MSRKPGFFPVEGPSRAVHSPPADGRPARLPYFYGWMHTSRRHDSNALMTDTNFKFLPPFTNCSLTNLRKEFSRCCIDKVGQSGWPAIRPRAGQESSTLA